MPVKLWDTLLLVGDKKSDRTHLRGVFESTYNLLEASNPDQALFLLEQNRTCIAAMLLDLPVPKSKKDSFLHLLQSRNLISDIPAIVLISSSGSGPVEELAFSYGASDVVTKPYSDTIIKRRVQTMVDLFRNKQNLLASLERQAETIRHTNEVMVDALSSIIEYRSAEAGGHIRRIRSFTHLLLNEVARSCPEYGLTDDTIRNITSAAALHDMGKISIPDHILNKPARLTPTECAVMKSHTVSGSQMVEFLNGAASEEYLRYAYNICRSHHERWDGSGYPDGLKGDEIPICAQAVGLTDAFDAITSKRVYKPAVPVDVAINMILNGRCGLFSPKLLECFKQVCPQFVEQAEAYAEGQSPKSEVFSLPLPSPDGKNYDLSSLQLAQLKYETLLHYTGASVLELDLDQNVHHVVYSPSPITAPFLVDFSSAENILSVADHYIYPEDRELALREFQFILTDFFSQRLRKHSYCHRIFSPERNRYCMHRITCLRLNTGDFIQRKLLVLWQPIPDGEETAAPLLIPENRALLSLFNVSLRRRADKWLTLHQGVQSLQRLLGYSRQELEEKFQNRFLDLVLPEDRDLLLGQIIQQLRSSNRFDLEYRLMHKNGRTVWVLDKGYIMSEPDGMEYVYSVLIDNTKSHVVQEELENALRRNQIIIDQTDDIIFEWDMVRNSLVFSPKWHSRFGYQPISQDVSNQLVRASHVHPDDLAILDTAMRKAREGTPYQEFELRIATVENKYIWCRIRATALLDNHGVPFHATGVIMDIDSAKRTDMALREKAEQDPLTHLLNKASVQLRAREHIETTSRSDRCALLMIDLDNFKSVNDRYGHLFGDTVLSRTAQTIRKLFRGGDIIGRVGGDEFMVLMKNIQSDQLVKDRCDLLLQELHSLFREDPAVCEVSCSIGVSFFPEHGRSFQELFQRADQALYLSKQSGKHCFTIYEDTLEMAIQHYSTSISNRIDSNEQPGLANDSLVQLVFRRLCQSTDLERTIQEVLELVGQQANVSRIYIFENDENNTHCSNTFEWCNEGIPPQIQNLQNVSYELDIPGWPDTYNENGIMFCTDITKLDKPHRDILEPQGIKSMLHCAIRENGVFRGFIGLDECAEHRIWTKEQISLLTFLAEMVASFLLRKRAQDCSTALSANLHSVLDGQNNWVYVIDADTLQLRYINEKARRTIPSLQPGALCYKAIMERDTPCETCPALALSQGKSARATVHCPLLGRDLSSEASSIQWDGADAFLVTCRDPEDP